MTSQWGGSACLRSTVKYGNQPGGKRGGIIWHLDEGKKLHVVEIKKGSAIGEHSHPYKATLIVISGKVLYREKGERNLEHTNELEGPNIISVPVNNFHQLVAL